MKGHWSHTCCTTKHLVNLYQSSLKRKEKNIEINFAHPHQGNDDMLEKKIIYISCLKYALAVAI